MLEEGMPYGVIRGRAWKRDDQGRKLVDSSGIAFHSNNLVLTGVADNTTSHP